MMLSHTIIWCLDDGLTYTGNV
uniref:Uncharacterized protein n=1 Tax=Arundo donax TaxID=35708 RepID=A0A0A9CKS7_ARUDO